MSADWNPTPDAVAGLVSDRTLIDGQFVDPGEDTEGTAPTLSWVLGRITSVAATVEYLATTPAAEALAAEYTLYQVAADVDSGWNAGRTIDQWTRSTEYRRRAAALLDQLTGGSDSGGSGVNGAGSPAYSFPEPRTIDSEVW